MTVTDAECTKKLSYHFLPHFMLDLIFTNIFHKTETEQSYIFSRKRSMGSNRRCHTMREDAHSVTIQTFRMSFIITLCCAKL